MRKKRKVHSFFPFWFETRKKIVQESLEDPHPKFVKYPAFVKRKTNVKALLCYPLV